jgi:stage V sporulation protein G
MHVTEVRISKLSNGNGGDKLEAFASVTFDDVLVVRGFRVYRGDEGPSVSFPSRKGGEDGKYYDTVFPLNRELRQVICKRVLEEFGTKEN